MVRVARGKALVAKLRAQAGVRDPEALAAYLGRFKKARKAGKSPAAAKKAADGKGGSSSNASRNAASSKPSTSSVPPAREVKASDSVGPERAARLDEIERRGYKKGQRVLGRPRRKERSSGEFKPISQPLEGIIHSVREDGFVGVMYEASNDRFKFHDPRDLRPALKTRKKK